MKVKSLLTGTSGGKAIYKPAPSTDHDPLEKGLSPNIYALRTPNDARSIGSRGTAPYGSSLEQTSYSLLSLRL